MDLRLLMLFATDVPGGIKNARIRSAFLKKVIRVKKGEKGSLNLFTSELFDAVIKAAE